jgi:hypothetical protein
MGVRRLDFDPSCLEADRFVKESPMSSEEKSVQTVEAPGQMALAPLPSSFEEETSLARKAEAQNLLALSLTDPQRVESYLKKRAEVLANITEIGIKRTHGYDWTLYRDEDGREVAVPRDSGCVVLRQWGGIRIGNYRPSNADGIVNPRIITEVEKGEEITVCEMWADGFCAVTGLFVESVYYAVRSNDEFVGRGTIQDLKSACRTGLDAKITRVLLGLRKVPVERLKEFGVKYDAMHKGKGYGTSTARRAARVTEEGVEDKRNELGREILRVTGGNKTEAVRVLLDVTSGKDFKGFESVARMTKGWQVDNAFEALKKHPLYAPPKEEAAS